MTPAANWIVLVGTAVLSALLTGVVRRIALQKQIGVVAPRERDVHTHPIPRLGGVAVGLSFLLVVLLVWFVTPQSLSFVSETVLGIDRNLYGIILGVLILLGVGIVDDIRNLSPWVKLAFHILAGVILTWSLIEVREITNPFGGNFTLGLWAAPFVVAWVVFMINVINWLDGLDGLASGVSLIATLILFFLAIKPDVAQYSMSVLALILAGSLIGFLPFNFSPAKIFLGDSGSQVLGFLLAVFAIISGGKLATAFLVLGVPILDVIWVIARRIATHRPIYEADRFHLHHRLLNAGLNQKQAVLLLYTLSAVFGMVALQTQAMGKFYAAIILIAMMIIGGASLVAIAAVRAKRGS